MARHVLTPEDAAKGGRMRGKIALKLQKEFKKQLGMELSNEIILALLTNPAIVGTGLYLLVEAVRTKPAGSPTSTNSFIAAWSQAFGNVLGINLANTPGAPGTSFSNIGLDALQGALLVYIGTGGNPTGITSTLGKVAGGAAAFLK